MEQKYRPILHSPKPLISGTSNHIKEALASYDRWFLIILMVFSVLGTMHLLLSLRKGWRGLFHGVCAVIEGPTTFLEVVRELSMREGLRIGFAVSPKTSFIISSAVEDFQDASRRADIIRSSKKLQQALKLGIPWSPSPSSRTPSLVAKFSHGRSTISYNSLIQ